MKLREEFLGFVAMTSTIGESIAEVMLSTWKIGVLMLAYYVGKDTMEPQT